MVKFLDGGTIIIRKFNLTSSEQVCLTAVGDICLGTGVKKYLKEKGSIFPFIHCQEELKETDILFGNLEMVICKNKNYSLSSKLDMCVPANLCTGLVNVGFDILNLANNHILDFGSQTVEDTISFLNKSNIQFIGYGKNLEDAWTHRIIEKKGIKIGFFGISDNWGQGAHKNKPGVAIYDKKKALYKVKELKKIVDHVIVSIHADLEFANYPDPERIQFSRKLIDYGASLILEHHPHVPQGIEVYKNGLIIYSLGNFIFDVEGSEYLKKGSKYTNISFILKVFLDKNGPIQAKILPIKINKYGQPVLLTGFKAQEVINHIWKLSQGIKDNNLLWQEWYKTCCKHLKRELWWLIYAFLNHGFFSFLKRLLYVVKTADSHRYLGGLVFYTFRKI